VVNIRHAAAADSDGLIHPILLRWQAGAAHWSTFGLPAVQVGGVVVGVFEAEGLVWVGWKDGGVRGGQGRRAGTLLWPASSAGGSRIGV
jgi:hypothetical protein